MAKLLVASNLSLRLGHSEQSFAVRAVGEFGSAMEAQLLSE